MISGPVLLNAAIIEPDPGARDRLRQACAASGCFDEIVMSKDSPEILEQVRSGNGFDVVFVSGRVDQAKLVLSQLKATFSPRDTAYVLVGERACSELGVISDLFDGFDGVLFEPFSVESLTEITELVARVQHDRAAARERIAIDLLVRELTGLIGELANCEQAGYRAPVTRRVLQEIRAVLAELSPEAAAYYYQALAEQFSSLHAPRRIYKGVSNRIRQKEQAKLETAAQEKLERITGLRKASSG